TSTFLSSESLAQSRTYLLAPDQAAWTHPPSCTGAAGTPCPSNVTVVAVPPSSGCLSSACWVAIATKSLPAPLCCNLASRAFWSWRRRPPGRKRLPLAASRTTGLSPTTVICRSPAPLSSSILVTSVPALPPSASTLVALTSPVLGSAV